MLKMIVTMLEQVNIIPCSINLIYITFCRISLSQTKQDSVN